MTTNLTKELAAIQERVSAATEGPWFASTATNLTGFTLDVDEDGMQGLGWTSHGDIPEYGYPDANFIAHARTDVEWMARALQAVVDRHVRSPLVYLGDDGEYSVCQGCARRWPCPTIRAIGEAMEAGA